MLATSSRTGEARNQSFDNFPTSLTLSPGTATKLRSVLSPAIPDELHWDWVAGSIIATFVFRESPGSTAGAIAWRCGPGSRATCQFAFLKVARPCRMICQFWQSPANIAWHPLPRIHGDPGILHPSLRRGSARLGNLSARRSGFVHPPRHRTVVCSYRLRPRPNNGAAGHSQAGNPKPNGCPSREDPRHFPTAQGL